MSQVTSLNEIVEFNTSFKTSVNLYLSLNKIEKVLVDGPSKRNPNILSGYTETGKLVHFEGDANLVGKIVNVKIKESHLYSLIGELVNE